jgi:GxxExxY protein
MDVNENELAHMVIGLAIEIHRIIGPGYPVKIYTECLQHEFEKNKVPVKFNIPVSLTYKELIMDSAYSIDCLVNDKLVLKFETCEQIHDGMVNSTLRTLRQGKYKLGLIINFHAPLLRKGIRRINNNKSE